MDLATCPTFTQQDVLQWDWKTEHTLHTTSLIKLLRLCSNQARSQSRHRPLICALARLWAGLITAHFAVPQHIKKRLPHGADCLCELAVSARQRVFQSKDWFKNEAGLDASDARHEHLTSICNYVVAKPQSMEGGVEAQQVSQLHGILVAVQQVVGEVKFSQGSVIFQRTDCRKQDNKISSVIL